MAPTMRSRLSAALHRLDPEVLFGRSVRPTDPRTLYFNQKLPPAYFDSKGRILKKHIYTTNQVITSKYTVFTFLPRNLLEQFRRVANIFFAAIAILQFFPRFSTISPGLVIIPILVVLLITAAKDAYEDVKRHQSDRRVNHSQVHVLQGPPGWENPNHTGKKSKTFVRGILKRKSKTSEVEMQEMKVDNSKPSAADIPDESADGYGWSLTPWEDLRVGDFVKILNNQQVPADIVICSSSEEENVAYVETKNLDGETNLKSRNSVAPLSHLRSARACTDPQLATFTIDSPSPDENMYRLNGKVVPAGDSVRPSPIDLQTVLLRGSVIRNTDWVIGIVLFTGLDTKIVMNSSGAPSKRSRVEKGMNPQVLINLGLLLVMAVACAIAETFIDKSFFRRGAPWTVDENIPSQSPNINGLATWANALITFQNVVPISLYISLEAVRSLQAAFIYFDGELWYAKTDTATLARNWNLSDDLGQIEYVFSDKTGTLTQNLMIFRHFSIGGKEYRKDESQDPALASEIGTRSSDSTEDAALKKEKSAVPPSSDRDASAPEEKVLEHFRNDELQADLKESMAADPSSPAASHARTLNGFFTVLSLCHTALASVNPKSGTVEYKAQSPDEAALVRAAADVGFVFRGRDREILRLQTPFVDHAERYELLNVLEFNSVRKRMSVVVKKLDDQDPRIFLLCKGADSVIFERLKPGNEDVRERTEEHLEQFANEGLRTLCLAYKVIGEQQYHDWSTRYHEASISLSDREKQLEAVSAEIETDLRLLGATAIEDKLQDGVPETIADLKRAGIKVWVATGDKLETAIAIGCSTNLIDKDSNLIVVRGGKHSARSQLAKAGAQFFGDEFTKSSPPENVLNAAEKRKSTDSHALRRTNTGLSSLVGENNGDRPGGFVLVIDGPALEEALDEENKDLLLRVSTLCEAVICCRVSPLQKALVVRLVKDGLHAMTLAIGDGANDVSMIQAAHVGVGISGEEGLQAVNASDYSIAQFRFLKRLLLVHGHWSYARNGNMIVNFFYKNLVCIGVLWWYQIYCAWSTQYVFDYTYLLFWNVFWSLATVIAIGIFDRFIGDDVLMALPELYRKGREGKWFGLGLFGAYALDALYQSAVVFFFVTYAYNTTASGTDGWAIANTESSTTMVIAAVMVVNAFNGLNTYAWTGWVFFAVLIGPVLIWLFTVVYSDISPGWFYVAVYGNNRFLFRSAYFWLCNLFVFFICLLPRYLAKAAKLLFWPDDLDILRVIKKYNPDIDVASHPMLGGHRQEKRDNTNAQGNSSEDLQPQERPSFQSRPSMGSRTDMATGLQYIHRGFGFLTEEDGVSIRRIQSNLSNRHAARQQEREGERESRAPERSGPSLFPSLCKTLRRNKNKNPPTTPP